MTSTNRNRSFYLTATLMILPVAMILAACQSSPQPSATITFTLTPTAAPITPAHTLTSRPSTATPQVLTSTPCQGSGCVTSTPSPSETFAPIDSPGSENTSLKGITLQFWYAAQAGDSVSMLPVLVSDFNKSNPWGFKVEITAYADPGQLSDQVRNTLYSGKLPDLLAGASYQGAGWDKNAKTMVDLNTYLNDPIFGITAKDQADFYPAIWQQANPAKRLGIPLHRTALGLYYNITWGRELGYASAPKTPEEFNQQACAAAKENGDGTGGWMITTETSTLVAWMYAFGGALVSPDGKGYQIDTTENRQALAFLKGMQTEGCAWSTTQLYPVTEFAERKALFVVGSTSGIADQVDTIQTSGSGDQWTVIPFPAEANPSGSTSPGVVIVRGPDMMITRSTPEHQLAAWLFTRWLISPETQSRWVSVDGSCPMRKATLDLLDNYAAAHTQWAALVRALSNAHTEPAFASWEIVRWVISDAASQLFSTTTAADDVPALIKMLQQTADEANVQVR